jgi:hypothetical protein
MLVFKGLMLLGKYWLFVARTIENINTLCEQKLESLFRHQHNIYEFYQCIIFLVCRIVSCPIMRKSNSDDNIKADHGVIGWTNTAMNLWVAHKSPRLISF